MALETKAPPTYYCSFCGKSQKEVEQLIAGPSVFICDECIDLCADIVAKKRLATAAAKSVEPVRDVFEHPNDLKA